MTRPADKPTCINDGCDRESRTFKPGPCRRCYDRAHYGREVSPTFPVTPLREYAERKGVFIDDLPENHLTLERADALCIDVLGVHPFEVFGNYYFTAVA